MDHLHIRLPTGLKKQLKKHCRDQNISVTSALIIMINKELRDGSLTNASATHDLDEGHALGFVLRQ